MYPLIVQVCCSQETSCIFKVCDLIIALVIVYPVEILLLKGIIKYLIDKVYN